MSWIIERWIVRAFGVLPQIPGAPRDDTELGVAAEIRHTDSGERRRNAARASLISNSREDAERKCRARVHAWVDEMNVGEAADPGCSLDTVLEGREMKV